MNAINYLRQDRGGSSMMANTQRSETLWRYFVIMFTLSSLHTSTPFGLHFKETPKEYNASINDAYKLFIHFALIYTGIDRSVRDNSFQKYLI